MFFLYSFEFQDVAALFVGIFAIIPSLVLNVISFIWETDDNRDRRKLLKESFPSRQSYQGQISISLSVNLLLCLFQVLFSTIFLLFVQFQLGPTWWHFKAIYYGIQFRKCQDEKKKRVLFVEMLRAERDATLLRLFEGFLESAPQLLIQSTFLYEFLWLRLKVVNFYRLPNWGKSCFLFLYKKFQFISKCSPSACLWLASAGPLPANTGLSG